MEAVPVGEPEGRNPTTTRRRVRITRTSIYPSQLSWVRQNWHTWCRPTLQAELAGSSEMKAPHGAPDQPTASGPKASVPAVAGWIQTDPVMTAPQGPVKPKSQVRKRGGDGTSVSNPNPAATRPSRTTMEDPTLPQRKRAKVHEDPDRTAALTLRARIRAAVAEHPVTPGLLGGRLRAFEPRWMALGFSEPVLGWVRGITVPITEADRAQAQGDHRSQWQKERAAADEALPHVQTEMGTMTGSGVLEPVKLADLPRVVIQNFYLLPKKNGQWRGIVDCRDLNKYVKTEKFKMETLERLLPMLAGLVFFGKIDIKSAYHHVPIREEDRCLFAIVHQGELYQATCLVMGYNRSPWTFTKLMAPVMGLLREYRIETNIFVDDVLVIGTLDREVSQLRVDVTLELLEALGFVISPKSELEVDQEMDFLGFRLDSRSRRVWMTHDKMREVRNKCRTFLRKGRWTARRLAQLIGLLDHTKLAIPRARIFLIELQLLKNRAKQQFGWDQEVPLNDPDWSREGAQEELRWWRDHAHKHQGRPWRAPTEFEHTLLTDASGSGWGATLNLRHFLHGYWGPAERVLSSNRREMLAVLQAVFGFQQQTKGSSLRIRSDNRSVVAALTLRSLRIPTMARLAKAVHTVAWAQGMTISADHIRGVDNGIADRLSRLAEERTTVWHERHNWQLDPELFALIAWLWGPRAVDLFATALNAQTARFFTWVDDAFRQEWPLEGAYANPPWPLIARLLWQIQSRGIHEMVIVVPAWLRQWWTVLVDSLIEPPVLLPSGPDTFRPATNAHVAGVGTPGWKALVCRVSGVAHRRQAFQDQLHAWWAGGESLESAFPHCELIHRIPVRRWNSVFPA